ncbi:MAG: hypothetical protein WDN26_05960 [Chitinophagaceae bacterium]
MEIKRNEATQNRPDGDRVLDAPYVFMDLPSFISQLKDEKAWEKNDRNGITIFKSEHVAIVIAALQKGAEIKDNVVDGFFTIQMLEGNARIITPDGDVDLAKKQIITFHPGIQHSIEAISDAIMLITNCSTDSD